MRYEDTRHFDIGGNTDPGDADIALTCLRCPDWTTWIQISTEDDGPAVLLADVLEVAEQHVETCPGVYRG